MAANGLRVLVYGATGSQSKPIVLKLLEKGHQPLALSRNPEKAASLRQAGAEVVTGDMLNAARLREVSEQVDAVSLQVPTFVPNPAEQPVYFRNAVDAAKSAGVKLIVYNTSGPLIEERTGNPMFDLRLDLLRYLNESGVPHIVIQPTVYMENLLGPWTRQALVDRDVLQYPVEEDQALGWIATQDVASLMVAALERPELANNRFIVSGERSFTGPQLADQFSEGLGRSITYRAMPLHEFGAFLDQMFGPGAGEGGVQGYRFQRENSHRIPMHVDMKPVLEKLPVRMTSAAEWSAQHKPAFIRD